MSKKQHISVAVRIRSLLPEQIRKEHQCVTVENNRISISSINKLKNFDLPMVFDKNSSQNSIFQNCNLLQGYNCAFLCCGQNRSGKSYTIEGEDSEESKGMVLRLVDYLSLKLGARNRKSTYMMRVGFIEIYQEEIIDLLGIRQKVNPQIVQKGRQIELKGVQLKHIQNINQIEDYWIIGNRKRHLAYSKKYRNSHKSTSIFTLYLQSVSQNEGVQQIRRGKLHMVDMSANIINMPFLINSPIKQQTQYNLSLNAFKNVSNALIYGKANMNIPYKDSKVTFLLRQNLGGLGRTSAIFHIIPTSSQYSSSLESLRMARVLMQIENEVYCDVHSNKSTIISRIQEIQGYQSKLSQIENNINSNRQILKTRIENTQDKNQFLQESLVEQRLKQVKNKVEQLTRQKINLRKKIENLQRLFVKLEFSEQKQMLFKKKYQDIHLQKNKLIWTQSLNYSKVLNGKDNTETNNKNRNHFQELFDLQVQFQEERELLLEKIRKIEGQFKFYERLSLQTVKKQEIDVLRGSSRYDQTKRSYEIPYFAVRQKKLRFAKKIFQSNKKTLSERKFLMIKSLSQRGGSIDKRSEEFCQKLEQRKKQSQGPTRENIHKYKNKIRKINEIKYIEMNNQYFPEQEINLKNSVEGNKFKKRKKERYESKSLTRFKFK